MVLVFAHQCDVDENARVATSIKRVTKSNSRQPVERGHPLSFDDVTVWFPRLPKPIEVVVDVVIAFCSFNSKTPHL